MLPEHRPSHTAAGFSEAAFSLLERKTQSSAPGNAFLGTLAIETLPSFPSSQSLPVPNTSLGQGVAEKTATGSVQWVLHTYTTEIKHRT